MICAVTEPAEIDVPPVPVRKSRRWPWWLLLLLLALGVMSALLYARHTMQLAETDMVRWQAGSEALDQRLATLERGIEQLRQSQQTMAHRLDSTTATHQVLREEVLGMGERAGLLEDAVARLSQSRMSGDSLLRLNEAEFLLSMGSERMNLYADVAATIQAFSLAEGTLSGLDDPALSTLRQTLAQELIQLRSVPADRRPQLRAELAELGAQLASLPASQEGAMAIAGTSDSRLAQLFSQLVTVRRVDPQTTLLGPAQRQAALAAVALQLELAQAALARPDQAAFDDALHQVEANSRALFDPQQEQVQQWFERIATLRQARLLPQLPVLGATLRELRALRAARNVGRRAELQLSPAGLAEPGSRPVPAGMGNTPAAPVASPHLERTGSAAPRVEVSPHDAQSEPDVEAPYELEREREAVLADEPEPVQSSIGARP